MVEMLSEASRRLEPAWKARFPDIPWSRIAGIGSVLRHNYEQIDLAVAFRLRSEGHFDRLRAAVEALLVRSSRTGGA
jgi:uncharacterized protein with HEPN domain